jgi:light-regulated signal transduction histidine kinase (bacteriophytochrome)
VLQRLSTVLKETEAEVTCDPLPVISGDKNLLGQLFQNLIENAAKYRGPQPPRIHISAERRNREYIFSVRDNGSGMARLSSTKPRQVAGNARPIFRRAP